jgi:hypothetical protein
VGGLTAVDGATVINEHYEALAFGVKIRRAGGNAPVEQMVITEPIVGDVAEVVHPAHNGGTRHLSAAQFVYDLRYRIGEYSLRGFITCLPHVPFTAVERFTYFAAWVSF